MSLPVARLPQSFTAAFKTGNFAVIADWFTIYFFIPGIIFIIFVGLMLSFEDRTLGLRVLSMSLIFSGSSTVCGWLLGLLFGIPRSLARPQVAARSDSTATRDSQPATETTGTRRATVNTNLEDVSDWLSKTLIGVGLTQLYQVPHFLWLASEKINKYGFGWDGHGQVLALSIFLYFAPGGFWLSYISTRTLLTRLFDDEFLFARDAFAGDALKSDQLQLNVDGTRIEPARAEETIAADRNFLKLSLHELSSPLQIAAWGAAKARANDYGSASAALKSAIDSEPSNSTFRDLFAKVLVAQGKDAEAGQVLGGTVSDTAVLTALYEDAPEGFTKAIRVGEEILRTPQATKSANLLVWLACAYGQQHGYLLEQGDNANAEKARVKVVNTVEAALKIDPTMKAWLHSLWKPAGSKDDDLSSISPTDPDLTRMLEAS